MWAATWWRIAATGCMPCPASSYRSRIRSIQPRTVSRGTSGTWSRDVVTHLKRQKTWWASHGLKDSGAVSHSLSSRAKATGDLRCSPVNSYAVISSRRAVTRVSGLSKTSAASTSSSAVTVRCVPWGRSWFSRSASTTASGVSSIYSSFRGSEPGAAASGRCMAWVSRPMKARLSRALSLARSGRRLSSSACP